MPMKRPIVKEVRESHPTKMVRFLREGHTLCCLGLALFWGSNLV
jgi:hypothetical protein